MVPRSEGGVTREQGVVDKHVLSVVHTHLVSAVHEPLPFTLGEAVEHDWKDGNGRYMHMCSYVNWSADVSFISFI